MMEYCKACGKEYIRDFRCRNAAVKSLKKHLTGRSCDDPACGKPLYDNIIHFGENLKQGQLDQADHHSSRSSASGVSGSERPVAPFPILRVY